jgi:hypothetical protein
MFTQVLGIMTSLIITSHSKERSFVLLHSQAIFQSVNRAFTSLPCCKHVAIAQQKTFFTEHETRPKLLSDNLYDVPEDSLVISESDKDDSVRERKIVCPKQSCSERQTSFEECDGSNDTSNAGATTWVKEDKTPNL